MTDSPVLLPSTASENGENFKCSMCKELCVTKDDHYCSNCGYDFKFRCDGCYGFLKPQHAFCPNCGQRQHSLLQILRHDLRTYRVPLIAGSAFLLIAFLAKRRPIPHKPHSCPAKIDLSIPNIDTIGKTAQSWSTWAVSWIPGTSK